MPEMMQKYGIKSDVAAITYHTTAIQKLRAFLTAYGVPIAYKFDASFEAKIPGTKIKQARHDLFLPTYVVAELAGIHRNFYIEIESGSAKLKNFTVEVALKISKVLKKSVFELFGEYYD